MNCTNVTRALSSYLTTDKSNLFWMYDSCADLFEDSHFRAISAKADEQSPLASLTTAITELYRFQSTVIDIVSHQLFTGMHACKLVARKSQIYSPQSSSFSQRSPVIAVLRLSPEEGSPDFKYRQVRMRYEPFSHYCEPNFRQKQVFIQPTGIHYFHT